VKWVACNLCGNAEAETLFAARDNQFRKGGIFNIVKCKECGFVYINPRPDMEEMKRSYEETPYYTHAEPELVKKDIRWKLKRLAFAEHFKLPGRRKMTAKIVYALLKKKIAVLSEARGKGTVLDIGCGNGVMLSIFEEAGWRTFGVEPDEIAARQAKGLLKGDVFPGTLFEAKYPANYFDMVTLVQVLEHMPDPIAILQECLKILKKNGILIVGVPNFDSYDSNIFKESWSSLQVPAHLYHFTWKTLEKSLQKAGFTVKERRRDYSLLKQYFPSYIRKNFQNLFRNNDLNHTNIGSTLGLTARFFLLKPVLHLVNRYRTSTNMVFYAIK
jgi:2-polyprenyl-3-methyl-5-hydroxy-6-metoxy-1,4-benzoquinol methylase